jgi:hypothetical protein
MHEIKPTRSRRPAVGAALAAALLALLAASAPQPSAAQAATINVVPSFHIVLRGTASRVPNPTAFKALAYQRVAGLWYVRRAAARVAGRPSGRTRAPVILAVLRQR